MKFNIKNVSNDNLVQSQQPFWFNDDENYIHVDDFDFCSNEYL